MTIKDQRVAVPAEEAGVTADEHPVAKRRLSLAAIGLALRSVDTAQKSFGTALRITDAVSGIAFAPARKIFKTLPFRPLRNGFEALVKRGEAEVEDWVETGALEMNRSRELAQDTASVIVDEVIRHLTTSPALQHLIRNQIDELIVELPKTTQIDVLVRVLANNYIHYLNENPEDVQSLIRVQGGVYLAHLEENPEQVQSLVQGQSTGLIESIMVEIRGITVTGDSLLEMVARKIFRRPPRSALPEPPPEVLARAPFARIESDFAKFTGDTDG